MRPGLALPLTTYVVRSQISVEPLLLRPAYTGHLILSSSSAIEQFVPWKMT